MDLRLILDGDNQVAKTPYGENNLHDYFDKIQGKYVNLGILPPVTKLITPIKHNSFDVLVEHRPRYQTVDIDGTAWTLPLPWHTLCFHLFYVNGYLRLGSVYLFFHSREATTEFDFTADFYKAPFFPNISGFGSICLHQQFPDIHPSEFSSLYYSVNDEIWGTRWNYDYVNTILYYCGLEFDDEDTQYPDLIERYNDLFETVSKMSLEEICEYNFPTIDCFDIDIDFLCHLPSINPVLTLNDLMKGGLK